MVERTKKSNKKSAKPAAKSVEIKYICREMVRKDFWKLDWKFQTFNSVEEAQAYIDKVNSGKMNSGIYVFRAAQFVSQKAA